MYIFYSGLLVIGQDSRVYSLEGLVQSRSMGGSENNHTLLGGVGVEEFGFVRDIVSKLPQVPGVYLYLDKQGNVIYVGKAKNLRNRISNYFHIDAALYPKTARLVSEIDKVRTIPTLSEVDAFILEQQLIRKFAPKYNIMLKDDGNYPYVVVRKVNSGDREYYRVLITRMPNADDVHVLGPFVEAAEIKRTMRVLRRIFPYADCSATKFRYYAARKRPCIYGQIGLCPAPCLSAEGSRANTINIRRLVDFLTKGQSETMRQLDKEMRKLIKQQAFEQAARIRDMLIKVNQLYNVGLIKGDYVEAPVLPEDAYKLRVKQIVEFFGLAVPNESSVRFRIEAYDISNIMGQYAVGGMTVSIGGRVERRAFRRFRIRTVNQISDVDMMAEVLRRRLKHEKDWGIPDLILIDGGRTQLKAVYNVLSSTHWIDRVFLASIFKPNDDFYVISANGRIHLKKVKERNWGIQHLRELRDEVHNYAKGYFRRLFDKVK